MIRLFLAALLPSLLAFLTLPVLAFSSADRPAVRLQERNIQQAIAADISIKDASFDPSEEEIKVGETVRWTNQSNRDHRIVIVREKEKIQSPVIAGGKTWTRKFTTAGTYEFHCAYHPRAKGTLKVVPAERR
jgi:plastocyanin